MCEMHYRRWWRATNYEYNKEYEKQHYQAITKPIRQLGNKPKERICLRCGKQFERIGRQIYCNLTCQNNMQHKNKRKNKPEFKLIHNIRSRLRKALKGSKRDKGILNLLGCSGDELRQYLESRFQSDMSWENYGTSWQVDHIKPLSTFNLLNTEELKIACHHSNLQPLWKEDHIKKTNSEALERYKAITTSIREV